MKVNIDKTKLTDSPYSTDRKEAFLIEDEESIDQISLELRHALPSSFLISGYRGVGKTSFVNRIIEKISSEFICVSINLAKYDGYSSTIKKLIRELHFQFEKFNEGKTLTSGQNQLKIDFQLLYDRTFNDIVNSHIVNSKKEKKATTELEFNLKKLAPILVMLISVTNLSFEWIPVKLFNILLFIGSLIWACMTTFKISFSKVKGDTTTTELSRKSLYDDNIAEHYLFATLKSLQNNSYKVLIAFDEIDKIQEITEVKSIISDLKFLLLSGYSNFFIIAGQSLFYEYEKAGFKDDQIISTLFSKNLHVPFLKFSALKKYCLSILKNDADKSSTMVRDYLDTQILASGRIPRKLVNLIRSQTKWDNDQAYLSIDEAKVKLYEKEKTLAEILTKIMDNQLPQISRNDVQLDFFIAQIYLWINKMKEYTDGNFLMTEIINPESYKDIYPDVYIAQLTPLKVLLTDELLAADILSEKRPDDDQAESSYYWTPEVKTSAPGSEDDGPATGDGPVDPDFSGPDNLPTAPSFVTDFADFEAFLRQIYFEFVPEDQERKYGPQQLVNRLIEIGVLTKTWYSSSKIKEIIDTRNKIVHGESIGPEELNVVQSSIFTLSRLKSEVIEDLTFHISQRYLQTFNLQKNKGGYDFVATRDDNAILFDVKYIQAGEPDTRNINEIFDKYSNYALGGSAKLQYVLFFFQPNRRKSFDDFYIKFNDTINAEHPELKNILNVFYITESDEKGYKEIIEGYLKTVMKKIGPSKNTPVSFFNEDEIAEAEQNIKDKSLRDWPSDYSMQVHLIQTQTEALHKLQQLDSKGLGDELFAKLALRSKNNWPGDYIMQLDDFLKQKTSFQKVENLISNDIPENILDQILKDAEKSWPNDYEMRIHQIETQIDAFKTLKNLPPDDITEQQFQNIANKAAKEYPKDFEMQLHTLQTQIESIRQLNKK